MIGRLASCLLIVAGTACGAVVPESAWQEEAESGIFDTGPYILLGEPGQAFILLKKDGIAAPEVEWWSEDSEPARVEAVRDDGLWVADLQDLPIGPAIHYRVHSSVGSTPERKFRVGAPPGAPVRFAVFGDTRTGHRVHRAVVEAMDREEIDFVVHTGDMVDRGGKEDQWIRFFQIERSLLWDTPIIPAVGNHDVSGRDYFRDFFQHQRWAKGRHYYALDWGPMRIVILDSGIECREGCAQYSFAEGALARGAKEGKLMVVGLHFPPYSSGGHGSSEEVQRPLTALSRRHGVELVVAAHDHNYERSVPIQGTTYVVSGSAGAPIRPVTPRWFSAEARTEPHYMIVEVSGGKMVVNAVNLDGETFDSVILEDNPPASGG